MAVDVKQLRIGSHILVNGKRERVRGLDEDNGLIIRFPAEYVNANEVEPIPITSEFLEKLGFEWREDSSCWRKEVGDDVWLFVNGKEEQGFRFNLFPPYWKGIQEPILYARCLHEIEGQLAYYGVELIEE